MELFYIPNLVSSMVERGNPWEIAETIEKPEFKTKKAFVKWTSQPGTRGCHYSTFEGLNPHARCSKDNPPVKIHGLVLDYDNKVSEKSFNSAKERALVGQAPVYIHRSQSENVRAVWLFEQPVFCYAPDITKRFLSAMVKALAARRLFPGLDKCYEDPLHYYEIGATEPWTKIGEPLSSEFVHLVLAEVSKKSNWGLQPGAVKIPMPEIEAEALKQYPGRWESNWEVGAQGVRFWDSTADNPRAAIIRETGVQCFTGPKPFVGWSEIFGRDFVKQFQAGTIGKVVGDTYFDGRLYWRKIGNEWYSSSRQDTCLHLQAQGLSPHVDEDPVSEVDQALLTIQTNKRIRAAVPLVHRPDGVVTLGPDQVLNTSTIKPCQPVKKEGLYWGEGFPFIRDYLDALFNNDEQDLIFKAWLQRFYLGCLYQKPNKGQAMLIGGPTGKGKTLLNTCFIGGLVGGHFDASDFLTGKNSYNGQMLRFAHWAIDDTAPSADDRAYAQYSSLLKKLTANREFQYSEKWEKSYMTPWDGRICITFNLDSESVRVIPDPEQSLLDKLIILKTDESPFEFPTDAGLEVKKELPAFARWLVEWNPPASTKSTSRYGVRSIHHPDLLDAARHSTASAGFAEIMEEFLDGFNEPYFEGTATGLLRAIMEDDTLKPLVSRMSSGSVGKQLSKLASNTGWGVEQQPSKKKGRIWKIENPFHAEKQKNKRGGGIKTKTK